MTAVLHCTRCGGPRIERTRTALAEALHDAVRLSGTNSRALAVHLLWFESELRGRCTDCVMDETAERVAALSVEVEPVPARDLADNVHPILRKRFATNFYEAALPPKGK